MTKTLDADLFDMETMEPDEEKEKEMVGMA